MWKRPVPLIGDPTSARERADDPRAWAMPTETRDALHDVIDARRDIRRYRPDDVPAELLERVLTAAHHAPSVGHSQPWRFVVVRDPETRERAALLADRERLRQAEGMDPESGSRLLDLQLEGIREAPLGVVVLCDRRTAAAGVLGRASFPDADLWSCACAIQNLWLAARAEGLGVGWVTLFQPADLAHLLDLPYGVETLGWLCLGWPDERPPAPGLERAGWSRRAPLSDVVLAERWPSDGPAAPVSRLRAPVPEVVVGVRDHADALLTPPGSLGVLDRALDRVLSLGPAPAGGTLLLVGADHLVIAHGVSAYDAAVTHEVLTAAVAGEAIGVTTARSAGLDVVVVDAGVAVPVPGALDSRPLDPRGDLVTSDALTAADGAGLVAHGRRLGEGDGLLVLGEVGVGNTTVAAALAAALLGLSAAETVGLGAGSDSDMVARKVSVVQRALDRLDRSADIGEPEPLRLQDPLRLLAARGGGEIAVLTGAVLGAVAAGRAVVLDGLATSVAALLAVRLEPGVSSHLIAGQRSRERAHALVLAELGLEPLLDLRLRAGEGVGGSLAAGMVLTALRARATTGRTA